MDIRDIFKKWAAKKFFGLVHIELADDLDIWCVKLEEEVLVRCHGLDAAHDAKELVCDFIAEIGRRDEALGAMREECDLLAAALNKEKARLAEAERGIKCQSADIRLAEQAMMDHADAAERYRALAEAAEAREKDLREALTLIANDERDPRCPEANASDIAREALAANPSEDRADAELDFPSAILTVSGYTDTQRLDWLQAHLIRTKWNEADEVFDAIYAAPRGELRPVIDAAMSADKAKEGGAK